MAMCTCIVLCIAEVMFELLVDFKCPKLLSTYFKKHYLYKVDKLNADGMRFMMSHYFTIDAKKKKNFLWLFHG